MVSAGQIRAGGVAVDVTLNDAGLKSGLQRAAAQIKQAAAGVNASADQGFGAGGGDLSFKWAQRIARGAGVGILAHTVGSAMSSLADILKGEWEGVGKAIEGVPILGGAAMSLANGFDDLFLGMRAGMEKMKAEALKGLRETQGILAVAVKIRAMQFETGLVKADPFNRKLMEINEKARLADEPLVKRLREIAEERSSYANVVAEKKAEAEKLSQREPDISNPSTWSRTPSVPPAIEEAIKKAQEAAAGLDAEENSIKALRATNEAFRVAGAGEVYGDRGTKEAEERQKSFLAVTEKAADSAGKWADALFAMDLELRQSRGEIDALSAREAQERRNLTKELASGTVSAEEYRRRLATLAATYDELALAEEGRRQAAEREAEWAAGKALTESLRTPEEKARAEIDGLRKMLAAGDITGDTFDRAIRKTLQDAAAAMPDVLRGTTEVRGTFNPMEAAGMGGGGVADQMLDAQRKTAKNTEKIAQLAAALGVTFS